MNDFKLLVEDLIFSFDFVGLLVKYSEILDMDESHFVDLMSHKFTKTTFLEYWWTQYEVFFIIMAWGFAILLWHVRNIRVNSQKNRYTGSALTKSKLVGKCIFI